MIRSAADPVWIGITIHVGKGAIYMTSGSGQSLPREVRDGTQMGASAGTSPDAPPGVPANAGGQYVPRQGMRYEDEGNVPEPRGAVMGFTILAAVLMMVSGIWDFFAGLAAIIRGSFFVTLPHYAFNLSVTGWGWFHLILGAVVFVAGAALLTDATWARAVGVAIAAISAVVNFLYIPYQPVWSIAVMAIDVIIIWALITPRRNYA
jgi:hypothetical protein